MFVVVGGNAPFIIYGRRLRIYPSVDRFPKAGHHPSAPLDCDSFTTLPGQSLARRECRWLVLDPIVPRVGLTGGPKTWTSSGARIGLSLGSLFWAVSGVVLSEDLRVGIKRKSKFFLLTLRPRKTRAARNPPSASSREGERPPFSLYSEMGDPTHLEGESLLG